MRADPPVRSQPPRRSDAVRRGIVARIVKWASVAGIWGAIGVGVLLTWYASDLPDIDAALQPTRKPAITVLAADGSKLATIGDYYGEALAVADLPPAVPRAVLAIEDRRFYQHFGVDVIRVVGALVANVEAGGVVQGGSTITQQAAKNLFLNHERTFRRKIQEVMLALWLEREFSKDQILAIYLNRVYFGSGAYGIDAAARKYYNRPATHLSTYQAAVLAGLLKAPSRYNPLVNPERADERARLVLAQMVDAGFLTAAQADAAKRSPGRVAVAQRPLGRYFADWVVGQVPSLITLPDDDVVVRTTLDPRLQRAAEARVTEFLDGPARKLRVGEAALVAMSLDGGVRAMVGGHDYDDGPFNRATQARRQPGSAFKPFVYLAGLEAGLSPGATFNDSPVRIAGWSPDNFTGRFQGTVTMREALAQSINTVAVQVSEYAGRRRVIGAARRLGISSDLTSSPSLALGTSEVTLLELTGAYAAIANGGYGLWPYAITDIRDGSGRVLYDHSTPGIGRVAAAQDIARLTGMMAAVVDSGTGRAAAFGRPAAGKTGTSQDFRDAWFMGFTADLVAGVWMGNDDNKPTKGVTGGQLPARLWRAFMTDAHQGLPVRPLPSLVPGSDDEPSTAVAERAAPDGGDASPTFWDRFTRLFGG